MVGYGGCIGDLKVLADWVFSFEFCYVIFLNYSIKIAIIIIIFKVFENRF